MENLIILLITALVVGLAGSYIHKERKRGVKCIGCPQGCSCSASCGGQCGCCSTGNHPSTQ